MPGGKGFVSEAQRRKFYALHRRGQMPQETIDRWEAETSNKALPERVGTRQKRIVRLRQRLRQKTRRRR